jgi:anti-sigma factor ChrR (cupin superfamily)
VIPERVKPERIVLTLDPAALARLDGYEPLRPGVDVLYLYQDEASGAATALLRYAPGAEVPPHTHQGFEHIVVLSGEQFDDRGRYPAGTFVVNPPGTGHRVWSPEGCLVLIMWQQPVAFREQAADKT